MSPEHRLEGAVAFGLAQPEYKLGRLVEPHAQPHVDRLHAQPDREMRLAAPGLAVEHQVLRARDEAESQEPARACSRREARCS